MMMWRVCVCRGRSSVSGGAYKRARERLTADIDLFSADYAVCGDRHADIIDSIHISHKRMMRTTHTHTHSICAECAPQTHVGRSIRTRILFAYKRTVHAYVCLRAQHTVQRKPIMCVRLMVEWCARIQRLFDVHILYCICMMCLCCC